MPRPILRARLWDAVRAVAMIAALALAAWAVPHTVVPLLDYFSKDGPARHRYGDDD